MTEQPHIRVKDLYFRYNGSEIIRGLNLAVEAGGFHGILGPNGSGKTTLVKLLSGVLRPASGSIEIFGEPIESYKPRKLARAVAVVPQGAQVSFPFSALEVVLMGRYPHLSGLSLEGRGDMELAREAMEMTGTWGLRHRAMNQLSGGEAQRVIVARALAQQPRILMLDEPTVFLDIKYQIGLMELLDKLHREKGLTILAVTHDLSLAARYVRGVTLMRDGLTLAEGPPEEVLTSQNIHDAFNAWVEVFKVGGRLGILPETGPGGAGKAGGVENGGKEQGD